MVRDLMSRPIGDLRISVTDRCNFRCAYCMPCDQYEWIEKGEILSFEEIARLTGLFRQLGVDKIRLTGGEPLLRRNLEVLVAMLSKAPLDDLCLTTNGSLLSEMAEALAAAGLRRVNVSVDSLDPEKFARITKRGELDKVMKGLFAAKEAGLRPIKINAVVERGVNDDEIIDLVEFAGTHGFGIRFIEYMDVGNANSWKSEKMISKKEILAIINSRFTLTEVGRDNDSAPSVDFRVGDGEIDVGVIASVTEPFCSTCNRARLTADGKLVTCLFSNRGHDLKDLLRSGADDAQVLDAIKAIWSKRADRYSEERLEALNSPTGYKPGEHKKLEMISLGG